MLIECLVGNTYLLVYFFYNNYCGLECEKYHNILWLLLFTTASSWCSYHFSFFTAYFRIDYLTNPIMRLFILFLCQLGTFTEHGYTFCIWSTYLFTFETILKAPITTGHVVLLRCHILLISVSKSFYFSNIFKYVLLVVWSCII